MRIRAVIAAATVAGAVWGGAASAATGMDIVYLAGAQADAVHDAGFAHAVRQMPAIVTNNPRWPNDRRIGKVSVVKSKLTSRTTKQIVAMVRRELRRPGNGGRVAIDELNPNHWNATQAQRLRAAWVALGSDVERVTIYAAPAMVEQVGRTDPRAALPNKLQRLVDVMYRSGRSYLQTYRGGWVPLPATEMAGHLTRWNQRWPARRSGRLGLLIGPGKGISQAELWGRVRGTAGGRALAANGIGIVGGSSMSTEEALAWMGEYRTFRANPTAPPPGGEVAAPPVGPPRITIDARVRPRAPFRLTANRAGRAVVRLLPLSGSRTGDGRVIGTLTFAAPGSRSDTLPADIRPGRYRLLVTFSGAGALGGNERTHRDITVLRAG